MRKGTFIFCLVLLFSCGEKKTDLTGNTPLKINDFNKAFKLAALPVTITDTNLAKYTDTVQIGRKALVQFIPDSIVEQIIASKDKKAILHPILKIEKVKLLSNKELKVISGGKTKDWDLCCLKDDSPILPPFGCESWIICQDF